METLLRKYLGTIDLAVIAICSLSIAHTTATLIESRLTHIAPSVPLANRARVARAAMSAPKSETEILKRNIFCSTCRSFDVHVGSVPPRSLPQATTLPLRLLAVMFAPPPNDPRWSTAIIRDDDDKTAGPYLQGAIIRAATISHIGQTRVYLDISGRKEYLDLVQATPRTLRAPPAELDSGIRKVAEHTYEIRRETLDLLLSDVNALAKAVRIVPESRDGKVVGFRLFNVRRDGPFAKIGLQEGDLISAINGLEITSPDNALAAYTRLRASSYLSVGLERHGRKISQDYRIR